MGVHESQVELGWSDGAADPLAQVLVLLVGGVGQHHEEVLVAPRRIADVLGRTGVADAVEHPADVRPFGVHQTRWTEISCTRVAEVVLVGEALVGPDRGDDREVLSTRSTRCRKLR